MVLRSESAHDRRSTLVTLTPAALTLLTDDRRRRDALLADLLDGLTPDERETLARAVPLLDRLAGA
jgi:DNA-binding MarR family transcriptional regulator